MWIAVLNHIGMYHILPFPFNSSTAVMSKLHMQKKEEECINI